MLIDSCTATRANTASPTNWRSPELVKALETLGFLGREGSKGTMLRYIAVTRTGGVELERPAAISKLMASEALQSVIERVKLRDVWLLAGKQEPD